MQDVHRAGGGCHRIYSRMLPVWKRWSFKNQLELHIERELYTSGRTKCFVVNSSQVARELHREYGTDESLFRVIHTAVDTERYAPAGDRAALRSNICAELGTDAARKAFLFVSLNHRRKGLDVLLDVWRDVDADLWIVGEALDFPLRLKIAQNKLQDKVRTVSARSEMQLLYQAADWFVHPTIYDACANTVLQSMSCGLPGLISVNDGATDHVRDGENGLLLRHPQEAASVFSTIQQACAMEESKRAALGGAARATMLPLSWQAHLTKWFDVIQEFHV
jgi:glycosyltransferase involved in cell wall biosynthesis